MIHFIFITVFFFIPPVPAEITKAENCKNAITDPESFGKAMTENLILHSWQEILFNFYKDNFFNGTTIILDKGFNDVTDILVKHPELSKKPVREYIITFERKIYEERESLTLLIKRFKRSYGKLKNNLFNIEVHLNVWKKWLSFNEGNNLQFKEYLNSFLNEKDRSFLVDSSKSYRERAVFLYRALNQIREEMLKANQDVQKISQIMLDLVHTAGFGNTYYNYLIKSKNAKKQLEGLHRILDERDSMAIELGFEGHFTQLQKNLGVKHPSSLSKKENIYEILKNIEKEIVPAPHNAENSNTVRVRALSLQESPFRSCLGGSDCSSNTYFYKALDPHFYYFTTTDQNHRSSGQITVVLGKAQNERGSIVPIGFVDKIQNVQKEMILPMLEGIRLSLEEQGYQLGLPQDVGNENGLSNIATIRGYIHEEVTPYLKKKLIEFKPHNSPYPFKNGYSRAYASLDLYEFQASPFELGVKIHPGKIHPPQKAPADLNWKKFYEQVLSWRTSEKEEDQIKFIKQLIVLYKIQDSTLSPEYIKKELNVKINEKRFSLKMRKLAFFTLIEFYGELKESLSYKEIIDLLNRFSNPEQQAIFGEMSNWKNGMNRKKRMFIEGLLLDREAEETISILQSNKLSPIVDVHITNQELVSPLMEAAGKGNKEAVKLLIQKGADIHGEDGSGYRALMWAAMKGHKDTVELLIQKGADIHAKSKYGGKTALMLAIKEEHKNIVELLIQKGADIHVKDRYGGTALMWAAYGGYKDIIELLIQKGADIHVKDRYGETALMWASMKGYKDTVELLIQKGADIHTKNTQGETALMGASLQGHKDTVELFIQKGVDIHAKDNKEETALMLAAMKGYKDTVELLIQKGADIHVKNRYGETALMGASLQGHKDIVELFIQKGVDIHAKDNKEETALMLAAMKGHKDTVELLIQKGADIHAKNKKGETALMGASLQGDKDIVKLLIQKGADIHGEDERGYRALMWASLQGDKDTVELLIQKGADFHTKNKKGETALMWAAYGGYKDIIELLIQKGANIHAKDNRGETALMWAVYGGQKDTVELLIQKGADIHAKNKKGETALMWAIKEGDKDIGFLLKKE